MCERVRARGCERARPFKVRCRTYAGTFCHRESGFIQQIAQEVAMQHSQNIWVDGSLRDGINSRHGLALMPWSHLARSHRAHSHFGRSGSTARLCDGMVCRHCLPACLPADGPHSGAELNRATVGCRWVGAHSRTAPCRACPRGTLD